jgi:hypothetical protein
MTLRIRCLSLDSDSIKAVERISLRNPLVKRNKRPKLRVEKRRKYYNSDRVARGRKGTETL